MVKSWRINLRFIRAIVKECSAWEEEKGIVLVSFFNRDAADCCAVTNWTHHCDTSLDNFHCANNYNFIIQLCSICWFIFAALLTTGIAIEVSHDTGKIRQLSPYI